MLYEVIVDEVHIVLDNKTIAREMTRLAWGSGCFWEKTEEFRPIFVGSCPYSAGERVGGPPVRATKEEVRDALLMVMLIKQSPVDAVNMLPAFYLASEYGKTCNVEAVPCE